MSTSECFLTSQSSKASYEINNKTFLVISSINNNYLYSLNCINKKIIYFQCGKKMFSYYSFL